MLYGNTGTDWGQAGEEEGQRDRERSHTGQLPAPRSPIILHGLPLSQPGFVGLNPRQPAV